jgi:hypothetical protein
LKILLAGTVAAIGVAASAILSASALAGFYLALNDADFGAWRWVFACTSTALATALPLALGLVAPALICARLHLPVRAAIAASGLLLGSSAYWFFFYISIVNSCTLDTPFPYGWVGACGS